MKNADKFKSELLEMKKRAFEDAVKRCSKELGLKYSPTVSITESPCPSSSLDAMAHIHLEEGVICIWERRLESLDLDTIKTIAAHEVAHLVSSFHDGEHARAQGELQTATWRPPQGVTVVNGGRRSSKRPIEPQKARPPQNVCSYHSCRKRTELCTCKHCEKLFCSEHLIPKSPMQPFQIKSWNDEEYRKPGHPCPDYVDYKKLKKKEDLERSWEALNKMTKIPMPKHQRVQDDWSTSGPRDKANWQELQPAIPPTTHSYVPNAEVEDPSNIEAKSHPKSRKSKIGISDTIAIIVAFLIVILLIAARL